MRIRSAGTPPARPLRPLAVAAAVGVGLTCLLLPTAPAARAAGAQETCGQPPPTPAAPPSPGTSPPAAPGITLCLTEQLLTRPSRLRPGQDADYTIAVQATSPPAPTTPASTPPAPTAADVTVALTAAAGARVPAFTSCPAGKGTGTCTLGTLVAGSPASRLRADLAIPPSAATGQQLTFTITVTTSTPGVPGPASTQALTVAAPTPAPASSTTSPAATQTGTGTPAATTTTAATATGATGTSGLGALATLPPLHTTAIASTSAQLSFPTVTPGPSLLPSPASLPPARRITAATAASQYPLDKGQLGLQAIGLALLAAGLVLALTRFSIRRRPQRDSEDAS